VQFEKERVGIFSQISKGLYDPAKQMTISPSSWKLPSIKFCPYTKRIRAPASKSYGEDELVDVCTAV
jgi:hypothetical protein